MKFNTFDLIRKLDIDITYEDEKSYKNKPISFKIHFPTFESFKKIQKQRADEEMNTIHSNIFKHFDKKHYSYDSSESFLIFDAHVFKNYIIMFYKDLLINRGIYLIKSESKNIYKIGLTTDIKKRITAFKLYKPIKILFYKKCGFARNVETELHRYFLQYSIGNEWFDFPNERNELLIFENQFKITTEEIYKISLRDIDLEGLLFDY